MQCIASEAAAAVAAPYRYAVVNFSFVEEEQVEHLRKVLNLEIFDIFK